MTSRLVAAAIAGALSVAGASVAAATATVSSTDAYRWEKRLLIVFADTADSAALLQQRQMAERESADFADRDLVLIDVIGDYVRGASDLAATLRRRYDAPAGTFSVVLVGKDGGVKLQSNEPIEARRLFETIDAMPMRRNEARRAPK